MIEFVQGDILKANVEALVNTVNCVGIMGRGIALQFKNEYPENFKFYLAACKKNNVMPGKMLVYETGLLSNPRYIINFPTKRHWRGKSRIEDIDSGLVDLSNIIEQFNIQSIAIPPLGSGLGGLKWDLVKSHITHYLKRNTNIKIVVYEPQGAPATEAMSHSREVPVMTEGRAVLVGLINRYLSGLLAPFITLLEVHKLMYFMQESGQPLRLRYQKGTYGPYAENLRNVFNAIEGYLISGYADGGDKPNKQLQLVPGAVEDAKVFLKNTPETQSRFEKVTRFVEGFESPLGLELLSTVYWVMKNDPVNSFEDVLRYTYEWNDRKRQFTSRQIALAEKVVIEKGWL